MPILTGTSAQPSYLEGVPLWVYGSSFTVDPGFACTSGMEFFKLVSARLRMASVSTFGVNGRSIREAGRRIVGGVGVTNAQWLTTRRGIGVIDTWVNDLGAFQNVAGDYTPRAFTAKDITGIRANLMACLAYMSAGTLLENTAGTKGGTWAADGALFDRSGGTNSVTTAAGATMTWSGVVVPEDHFFYLGHVLEPSSFATAAVEVLVDGAVVRTIPATDFHCHSLVEGTTVATGSAAFRIDVTPGTHTVQLRHAGSAGQNMLVDALVIPKPEAKRSPIFLIQDQLPRGVEGGSFYRPNDLPTLQANWPLLQAIYDEAIAQFPNATLVRTTLDNTQDYGADGLHPNDRGMIRKADELVAAIEKFVSTRRPDNLYAIV